MKRNELMIETNELMIGNYVNIIINGNTYLAIVTKIDGYTDEIRVSFLATPNDWEETTTFDDIKPILLTKEILEKNDFYYNEAEETAATYSYHQWTLRNTCFSLDDNSWWREKKDDILRTKFGTAEIKYFHELQNILTLSKIKKEIKP